MENINVKMEEIKYVATQISTIVTFLYVNRPAELKQIKIRRKLYNLKKAPHHLCNFLLFALIQVRVLKTNICRLGLKGEVSVISRRRRLRLITLTETLIILATRKT